MAKSPPPLRRMVRLCVSRPACRASGGPQNVKAVDPCAVTYDVALYGCKRTGTAAAYELEIQIPAVSRAEHFHHLARRSSLHELGRGPRSRTPRCRPVVPPVRSGPGAASDRAAAARAQPTCESIKISSHCGCHRTVVVASTPRLRVRACVPRRASGVPGRRSMQRLQPRRYCRTADAPFDYILTTAAYAPESAATRLRSLLGSRGAPCPASRSPQPSRSWPF